MLNVLLASTPYTPPYNIKSDYGFLHVYALTMTLGILFSIIACYIKAKKHSLQVEVLILSVVFIIPSALLFASFFGKVNFTDWKWNLLYIFSLFSFWSKSGGMSIHGGVLGGIIAALIFFIYPSKKYKISIWVWLDCIVPNILIGQAIGRWGNFFNHELLGAVINKESLNWLPNFIKENCWQWGSPIRPETDVSGDIVYREPIFLYESFLDFMAWLFITFMLPKIPLWISKKPWNNKLLKEKKYKYSFKYSLFYSPLLKFVKFLRLKNWENKLKKIKDYKYKDYYTYNEIWNLEYYIQKFSNEDIKKHYNKKNKFGNNSLMKLNNPYKYFIPKSGLEGGAYFFFWNIIRLFLETRRDNDNDLFIQGLRTLDYTVITLFSLVGIILIIISQWLMPYRRKPGWLYEKEF